MAILIVFGGIILISLVIIIPCAILLAILNIPEGNKANEKVINKKNSRVNSNLNYNVALNSLFINDKEKGKLGEKIVASELEKINGDKKILNDIMINDQGKSRQIDHIAITEYGVFVIETKNYAGSIYGNEKSYEWKQYLRRKEFKMLNPVHQNYAHYQIVKKAIYDESIYVEPIVVFTDRCKLMVNTTSKVTYSSMLVSYINNKPKVLSKEKIDEIYKNIIEEKITNEEQIKDHEYNVKKYIEYKERNIEKGICPRCGEKLVIKNSENGQFYGCSAFPTCNFIKNI